MGILKTRFCPNRVSLSLSLCVYLYLLNMQEGSRLYNSLFKPKSVSQVQTCNISCFPLFVHVPVSAKESTTTGNSTEAQFNGCELRTRQLEIKGCHCLNLIKSCVIRFHRSKETAFWETMHKIIQWKETWSGHYEQRMLSLFQWCFERKKKTRHRKVLLGMNWIENEK